ncbi:hypothetical protein Tco_0414351 [Tanacetum coccineum]
MYQYIYLSRSRNVDMDGEEGRQRLAEIYEVIQEVMVGSTHSLGEEHTLKNSSETVRWRQYGVSGRDNRRDMSRLRLMMLQVESFPYEVDGDQTPPLPTEPSDSEPPIAELPNAESSDSVSSDSESSDFESEDEEADITPGPTIRTATQRPFAIHDFPRGIYKVGESSAARDSSYVSGLEP